MKRPSLLILGAAAAIFGLQCLGANVADAQKHKPKPPAKKKPVAKPKKPATPPKQPAAPAGGGDVALGEKLFAANCVACHKVNGKGGAIGPDLSEEGSKHDAKWLRDHISDPKTHTPGSSMPAFKDTLKGKDMDAIVAYVASLKAKGAAAPAAAAASGNMGPKADPAVVVKLTKAGALVQEVAQNDNRLDIAFNLAGGTVNDAAIAPLAALKRVYSLNLARTGVTDSGLGALKGLSDLVVLHLENTKISDAGLAHLKNLKNLEYLNLYNTQVTDAGLDQLDGLKKLKHIYLWNSKVTKAGADKLKQSLPQCDVNLGAELEAKPAS